MKTFCSVATFLCAVVAFALVAYPDHEVYADSVVPENQVCKMLKQSANMECDQNDELNIIMDDELSEIELMKDRMNTELDAISEISDPEAWYIAYRDIVCRYSEWFDMPATIYDEFDESEVRLICRTVETECYDQDFNSKCNVASVILNRYRNGGYGETITDIITGKNQFAYGREQITDRTLLSVMYVYEIGDTTDGCVAFRSDEKPDTWCGWQYSFTDLCGHNFYKERSDDAQD